MKTYSYSLLLQYQSQGKTGDHPLALYGNLLQEAVAFGTVEFQKTKMDIIQKNGTILRGGLSHFLSTPLKSDTDEIIRLIRDGIEHSVQQLDAAPMLETVEHSLWNIMDPAAVPLQRQMVGVMKRMMKNGRALLADSGCTFGKNSGETALSLFEFDGFSTLKSLTTMIDGIGLPQLLPVSATFRKSLTAIDAGEWSDKNLLLIDFNSSSGSAADEINNRLPVLIDQFGIRHVRLSKKSMHSSDGGSLQIRIGMDIQKNPLGPVILSLVGDHSALEEAITNHGSLIVLERFP